MTRLFLCLLLLLLTSSVQAQALKLLATAQDAWSLADQDAVQISKTEEGKQALYYLRYIWIESGDIDDLRIVSLDLNEVLNRATLIVRPTPVQGVTREGIKVLLARFDLTQYAPRQDNLYQKDLEEITRVWEELQFEPRFNFLFTQDTLKFASSLITDPERLIYVRKQGWKTISVAPYLQDGKTYNAKWIQTGVEDVTVKVKDLEHFDRDSVIVARLPGEHIDPKVVERLTHATRSQAPVVSLGYFHYRSMATIKDVVSNPLFANVFGGLYYDFAGIGRKFKKGTDLDNFLAQAGIGDVEKGVTFRQVFAQLRTDQKVAMAHSKVTDSQRAVFIFPSLLRGQVRLTFDLKRSSIDIGQQFTANLQREVADAHEAFRRKRNGLQEIALFNGQGELQDEAPFDVAKDHTAPAPKHGRLQGYINCASCHEAEGSDNYKRLSNDAKTLFTNRLEFLGDRTQYDRSVIDQQDRVYGAFLGDPEVDYIRGRDDHARAVLKATGPWTNSTRGQADVAKLAAQRQVKLWREYDGLVDPKEALAWFGFQANNNEESTQALKTLLPPDRRNLTPYGTLEDPRIALLKSGISTTRMDFALAYGFAVPRTKVRLTELRSKR